MDLKLRNFYLEARIKNAAPGQLLVMLYDGLIDYAERAETALAAPELAQDAETVALGEHDIEQKEVRSVALEPDKRLFAGKSDGGAIAFLGEALLQGAGQLAFVFDNEYLHHSPGYPQRLAAILVLYPTLKQAETEIRIVCVLS